MIHRHIDLDSLVMRYVATTAHEPIVIAAAYLRYAFLDVVAEGLPVVTRIHFPEVSALRFVCILSSSRHD